MVEGCSTTGVPGQSHSCHILSLYISLICPLQHYIMLNIGWWCSVPRAEAKGALDSVSMIYSFLHYPFCFGSPLVPTPRILSIPASFSTLPPLRWPPWEYQALLLPPPCQCPLFWPPLCIQAYVQNGSSRYVMCHCVMPPRDIHVYLLKSCHPHCIYSVDIDM